MKGSLSPKVKICCISSTAEAALAMKYGADALGLVGAMPSGPGIITDNQIKEIAVYIPPHVDSFLLTSETSASAIIAHHQKVNTCLLYTSPSPRDRQKSRMPSSA